MEPARVFNTGHYGVGAADAPWLSTSTQHKGTTVIKITMSLGDTETHAQVLGEVVVRNHDPRFDQDLTHRDIQGFDQATDVFQLGGGILNQQGIGAIVHRDVAAGGGQQLVVRRFEQGSQVRRFGVIDLDEFGSQRCQFFDLLLGFKFQFFPGSDLFGGCDQHDVVGLPLGQASGLEDNVQRLIPGDVFQPQGDSAGHGIAGDHVQPGEIRQQLKNGPDLDVLKVQGQTLARVNQLLFEDALLFGLGQRSHINSVEFVSLIGQELVLPAGGNLHMHVATHRLGVDQGDRGGEIGHVQPLNQCLRQVGVQKIHDHTFALLAHVDRGTRIAERNQYPAFPLRTAPEIHVLEASAIRRLRGRAPGHDPRGTPVNIHFCPFCNRAGATALEGKDHFVALEIKGIRDHSHQVHHHAHAVSRLYSSDTAHQTNPDILSLTVQGAAHPGKIQGDTRRRVRRKAGRLSNRCGHGEHKLNLVSR